jgi:thiamine biosynthesis protein ThiI
MNYDYCLIRFGELNTKGKNKKDFIVALAKDLRHKLKPYFSARVEATHDRIYVKMNNENVSDILDVLKKTPGIQSYSPVYKIERDIDEIEKTVLELVKDIQKNTFSIRINRADKTFPYDSMQIIHRIAGKIQEATSMKVKLVNPDLEIKIDIKENGIYVFSEVIQGLGGFPAGISGKSIVLMSGGIDSPVAAFEMIKRGVKIVAVHFASPPYTSEQALQKVRDLLKVLTSYQSKIKLVIVNTTKLQEEIVKNTSESYNITILRRMMYRIAEIMAHKNNCSALASGESIGQVASQTLESMLVINSVVKLPMIRPLATVDKTTIMHQATALGTYDISILPFVDCCTVFTPVNPVTKPKIKIAELEESKIQFSDLIYEAVKTSVVEWIEE